MRRFPSSWRSLATRLGGRTKVTHRAALTKRRQLEVLERRELLTATTWEVNTNVDENDGWGTNGQSLREAIVQAAANPNPDGHEIVFLPSALAGDGEIDLLHGQINLTGLSDDITIVGPGADSLTIDGQGLSRVFQVGSSAIATIEGLTITGGYSRAGGSLEKGGGIYSTGVLTLDSVDVVNNDAKYGGGIYASGSSSELTVINSTFEGNTAYAAAGLHADTLNLQISGSSIVNNDASIYTGMFVGTKVGGSSRIENTTVSGNDATGVTGGIQVSTGAGEATLEIVNSTIVRNTAATQGGGIRGSDVLLKNSILAENTAASGGNLYYTSLAGGSTGNLLSNELSGYSTGNTILSSGADAGLLDLGDYGGPTPTHALKHDSPAMDVGLDTNATGLASDQRGFSRDADLGDADSDGETVDAGAVERQIITTVVDTLVDEDGTNSSSTSLREAVDAANADAYSTHVIEFASGLFSGGTVDINLMHGQIKIDGLTTIDGPGRDLLTIKGPGQHGTTNSRVFQVGSSAIAIIEGLTITDGHSRAGGSLEKGGGIYSTGVLTLDSVDVVNNDAKYGGGIYASGSSSELTVINSTFEGNTAYAAAGLHADTLNLQISGSSIVNNDASIYTGMFVGTKVGGSSRIENTTVSGNDATGVTGGIQVSTGAGEATLEIVNSTIVRNTAATQGGGIRGSDVLLKNSILAENTAASGGNLYYTSLAGGSTGNLLSNELSGYSTGNTILSSGADAGLLDLGDYGGDNPAHLPSTTSPAIDVGDDALAEGLTSDQRANGYRRQYGSQVDAGAVEANVIRTLATSLKVFGTDAADYLDAKINGTSATAYFYDQTGSTLLYSVSDSDPTSITDLQVSALGGDDVARGTAPTVALPSLLSFTVDGGYGDDTVEVVEEATSIARNFTLIGGAGTDTIFGGEGSDTFLDVGADASEDLFIGNAGADVPSELAPKGSSIAVVSSAYSLRMDWSSTTATSAVISWGDGSESTVTPANTTISHIFASAGSYSIVTESLIGGDLARSESLDVTALVQGGLSPTNVDVDWLSATGSTEVTWTNTTTSPDNFFVERSLDGLSDWQQAAVTPGYSTSLLSNHTHQPYFYRVSTIKSGNVSTPSSPVRTNYGPEPLGIDIDVVTSGATATVTLSWPVDYELQQNPAGSTYNIYRKQIGDTSWGSPIDTGTGSDFDYSWSESVTSGQLYQYKVSRSGVRPGSSHVYASTGADATQHESRGSIVLAIDDRLDNALAFELERLERDLVGDGWNVIKQSVDVETATVPSVRSAIIGHYITHSGTATQVQSVLLIGKIPIPKSGFSDPGNHSDNEALSADTYYGDIDGIWDDTATRTDGWQNNLPGDGKFDENYVPTAGDAGGATQELSVGRIDMRGMAITDSSSEYTGQGAWQSYEIEVGKSYTGTFDSLALVVGDVLGSATGPGEFKNLTIESGGVTTTIAFDELTYAPARAELAVQRDGRNSNHGPGPIVTNASTITFPDDRNNWLIAKRDDNDDGIHEPFIITEDTVLQFEFRTDPTDPTATPPFVGIGFDKDLEVDSLDRETMDGDFLFRVNSRYSVSDPYSLYGQAVDTSHEYELIRRYLNKDHAFRHGLVDVENRAVVDDVLRRHDAVDAAHAMFGSDGAFSETGVGETWHAELDDETALWGFGGASGTAWWIGEDTFPARARAVSTFQLAASESNAVFTTTRSSYSHEWDRADGVMRSIIADEGLGLTAVYGFSSDVAFQRMAVGATIGEAYLDTQHQSAGFTPSSAKTYRSLLGDPTLRLHILDAPSGVIATQASPSTVNLTWTPSSEDTVNGGAIDSGYAGDFLGYHIYRATSWGSAFTRVSNPPTDDLFDGSSAATLSGSTSDVWMVRAVRRESSNAGLYINLSQGAYSDFGSVAEAVNFGSLSAAGGFSADTTAGITASAAITADDPSVPIDTPTSLFDSARTGSSISSTITGLTAGGSYALRFYFAEIAPLVTGAGDRLFDVAVEGLVVLDDYDISSEVGNHAGVVKTFMAVADANGELSIQLTGVVGDALISGLEVITA